MTENNKGSVQTPVNAERAVRQRIKLWLQRTKYTDFVAEIQQNVIGNTDAIETLCLSIWLYLERIGKGLPNDSNVFLIGSSGSGKTELYRQLKRYFERELYFLPVCHKDASQLSRVSYVGAEPSSIVDYLIDHYHTNGIGFVFCDEWDKLLKSHPTSSGDDPGHTLQYQMLCILEGSTIKGENTKEGQPVHSINTGNTLFIGMGSCMDIREQKSLNKKHKMGFSSIAEDNASDDEIITREDLLNNGATAELLGRFGTIINLKRLDDDEIRKVITLLVKSEEDSIDIPIELAPSMVDKLLEDRDSPMGVRMYRSRIHDRLLGVMKKIKRGCYYKENIEKIYLSEEGDEIIQNFVPFREANTNKSIQSQ